MQIRLRVITLQGAIEKSQIKKTIKKNRIFNNNESDLMDFY